MKRPLKERRELFAGSQAECAIFIAETCEDRRQDCARYEIVANVTPGPTHSVFYARKPASKTIRKPITRELSRNFRHYKRPLVVTLYPPDANNEADSIEFRLKGCRDRVRVDLEKVYSVALQWRAFRLMAEKRAARAAKRKARKTA